MYLQGKKILLGVTGGIAAYKACELLRVLQKRGADVRVVMTEEAARFVGPTTFAALSGYPVYTKNAESLAHIEYAHWADIYLVAPCTATSLARFAIGTGEEPVSLCFLAAQGDKWIAPAMNLAMFNSPIVGYNLKIVSDCAHIIKPTTGHLACGEEGIGKLPEPEDIADEIEFNVANAEHRMLITMGRTQEAIDPVRYISNNSSGKTGVEIAKVFLRNNWMVQAVCGPMEAKLPKQCWITEAKSAESMNKAVLKNQPEVEVIIHCAAVADYRPKKAALQKIKNSRAIKTLTLEETPNILKNTVKKKKQIIVSFALETENALKNAEQKFKSGGMDILVVNTAENFGKDVVEYGIFTKKNRKPKLMRESKQYLAELLFTEINDLR